jgi:hypothetical protein
MRKRFSSSHEPCPESRKKPDKVSIFEGHPSGDDCFPFNRENKRSFAQ